MKNNFSEFNIVISGVGGQGLITLLRVIAQAALGEGYDVKTSELHGLSQRGGSVDVHLRFGREIWSPLVSRGKANLIISLEAREALGVSHYASPPPKFGGGPAKNETVFLVNDFHLPIPGKTLLASQEILKELKRLSKRVLLIPASKICQKELGSDVVAGIYMLGYASFKNLIPLKPNSISRAIKKIIPEKYLELNLKTFKLAKTY